MPSPYPRDVSAWSATTDRLLSAYPIRMKEMVEVVLTSWEDIFHSRFGAKGYQIGVHIWPEPQIIGFLLHELVPLNLSTIRPKTWRRGRSANECDAVYIRDDSKSFEIKTSSSISGIFGNRSYAHVSEAARKRRGSFFLTVNFQKFDRADVRPEVSLIRFGWLGPEDWIGQLAQSGQQARLTRDAKAFKLRIIYEASK